MSPSHLRLDLAIDVSRAQAEHESSCPEIGPICAVRAEPPQNHHTTFWLTDFRLLAEYGLVPQLAVQATLPLRLIDTQTRYSDLSGNPLELDYPDIHHRNQTLVGLGDVQLALHGATRVGGLELGARLGASLPTGQVHPNPFELGERGLTHEHIQLGTGTVDPVLSLDIAKAFNAWSLGGFAQAQVPLYQGPQGLRAGARLLAGLVGTSGLGFDAAQFRLALIGSGELAERWEGHVPLEDGNQGRVDLFLGPGVTVPFADDWSVSVDVRARVFGRAVNAQLELPLMVEVSLGRLLHLEGDEHEHHEDEESGADQGDVADLVHAGEEVALTGVAGKWTVFDFWAPWCEACTTLDAELRALAAADEGIALRRVNIVDFESPISRKELPGVSQLPRARLVNPEGKTVWEGSGAPDEILRELGKALTTRGQ